MQLRLCYFVVLFSSTIFTQNDLQNKSFFDVNYFSGTIPLHNNQILHLIKGHPEGFIFSWNKKTFGNKAWQARYNFPDYGVSFMYQDLKNQNLGNNTGLYGHYNFYFLKRRLMLRIAQGIAYTSNPYDRINNPKNIAFGSRLLSSTYIMLNYKTGRFFKCFQWQGGLSLIHYSNGNIKAPNKSINTLALNIGLSYHISKTVPKYKDLDTEDSSFTQPIKYNLVFRSGINQSDIIGTKQHPFYIFSVYADKRIHQKSAIQLGTEVFFSNFLKEYITYQSVAFPEFNISGQEDYRRVGVFVGHELFINTISILSQLGYYVYYPFDFEGRTYLRLGLKRYFGNRFFGAITLKSHGFAAEAIELGIGARL